MKKDLTDVEIAKRYIQKAKATRDRGIKFALSFVSYKNMVMAEKCYYTGAEMTRSKSSGAQRPTDQTIDRINSKVGYVKGNVVSCCHAANQLKSLCENGGALNLNGAIRVLTKARDHIKRTRK